MLVTYCSNDSSNRYGDKIVAVEAGILPYEDVAILRQRFSYTVELEVANDDVVMLTPSGLVIDMTGEEVVVRAKSDAELLVDYTPLKQSEIISGANAAMQAITDTYSENEKLSWAKQEAEAKALLADANADAPLLRAIAAARGIDLTVLRDKVLANVAQYEIATGTILGRQQKMEDALKAAKTLEEAQAIEVSYV